MLAAACSRGYEIHEGMVTEIRWPAWSNQKSWRHSMIDLHCHILPGLDDGAPDMETALHMAALAVRSGIGAMVVTPHCAGDRVEQTLEGLDRLRSAVDAAGIPLRLYGGMEIFGGPDTAALLRAGRLLTINNSRYPLIEFAFDSDGGEETAVLQSVLQAGYIPLVAHPERYRYIQEDPELVNLWAQMGCRFQVNRGSLFGRFGRRAMEVAWALTGRGFATVVASDAHSASRRTPWMRDVWELLEQQISPTAAAWLLEENPRRIINNERLPSAEPEWF